MRLPARSGLSSRANVLALAYAAATAGSVGAFGFSLLSVGIPAAILLALFADGIARPGSSLFYPTVTHGPRTGQRVALSFDDGPDPQVTPAVLDALAQYDARATFFTIGRSLEAHPHLAQRLLAEHHELGNHSWQHSRWQNFFGVRRQLLEIERGGQAVATLTGATHPPLYRPPIGLKSPPLAQAARRLQLTLVAWSLHSRDSQGDDPQRIARRVLRKIRPGDIVLMHDGHDRPGHHRPACAPALQLILQGLHERHLRCVTVSELLSRDRLNAGIAVQPTAARARGDPELLGANRGFYDPLWRDARLIMPERFNTWPLVRLLLDRSPRRLEVAPGLRPRLPIAGTQFVDISAPALARLRERGGHATQGSITALPFPDGAFDLVCALDIVEHVDDEDGALSELSRVAAPGAALLLSVPLHPEQWTAFDDFVGHRRRYEPQRLRSKLAEHGFVVDQSAAYGMQPKSSRLLDLGMWHLVHRRERAMWWYNHVFMPLGVRFQKRLALVPGLIDDLNVAEIILVCRKASTPTAPARMSRP